MAKLEIDGTTVYTDDFNEEQMNAFREIESVAQEISRLEFLTHCLKQRQIQLAPMLLPKEEDKDSEQDETSTSA